MEKIHGTSAHVSWRDGRLHFSSGSASSTRFKALFDEPAMTAKFMEHIGVGKAATVYGEAYGGKLMGMSKTYGIELGFVVFDIKIDDLWLAVPQAHQLAESLGFQFVHYVKIPTNLEAISRERDADSVQAIRCGMGPGHIREGVVLRPPIEVRKNNDERIIMKHKRDEFRETQETRSVEVDPARLKVLQEAEQIADEWVTARRMEHVLGKVEGDLTPKRTPEVIAAVLEDVLREGKGEFVDSPEARKAIGKKAAYEFLQTFKRKEATI
jgi:hypothetical protein